MARKEKMQTIDVIMETMEEKQRKELGAIITRGLISMDLTNVEWKEFKVYLSSVEKFKCILKSPKYILGIADCVGDYSGEVQIAVIIEDEPNVSAIKVDQSTMLIIVSISEKELKELQSKK